VRALHAVFFDAGNTLLYPWPSVAEVCRQVLGDSGHERDLSTIEALMPQVDQYYEDRYRADDAFWANEDETVSVWVGMYSLLCRELGIDSDAVHIGLRVYDEFGRPDRWKVHEDVVPALERLRARGLALGVISNWDRRLTTILEGLGIREYFDTVVSSADVGLRKPDPRIFELACVRVGVSATSAAHVGDHPYADVCGARSVGMHAVLVSRQNDEVCSAEHDTACIQDFRRIEVALGLE